MKRGGIISFLVVSCLQFPQNSSCDATRRRRTLRLVLASCLMPLHHHHWQNPRKTIQKNPNLVSGRSSELFDSSLVLSFCLLDTPFQSLPHLYRSIQCRLLSHTQTKNLLIKKKKEEKHFQLANMSKARLNFFFVSTWRKEKI